MNRSADPPRAPGTKLPSYTRRTDLHASNACQAPENTASAVAAADVAGSADQVVSSHCDTVNECGHWVNFKVLTADISGLRRLLENVWLELLHMSIRNYKSRKMNFGIPSKVQSEPSSLTTFLWLENPGTGQGLIRYSQTLINFLIVLKRLLPYRAALTLGF